MPSYKAGVIEYYPLSAGTAQETREKNLNEYRNHIAEALRQSVDIIVFPEYGITNLFANPEEYSVEINETTKEIIELRDMAIEHVIYIVVNLLEKVQEDSSAIKYYNTNLVFDKHGNIILKYRKINLDSQEHKLTPGDSKQNLTFTTSFGTTFGIFTGLDILFDNPSRRVFENAEVTDIVYPTAWFSTLPFFASLSVQHGYSVANGVNLLAADFGRPSEGLGGSGIYSSSGKALELYISDSPSSKRLVQDVGKVTKRENKTNCSPFQAFGLPEDVHRNNVSNFKIVQNLQVDYKFQNVDLTQKNSSVHLCNGDFCCDFDIILDLSKVKSSDKYKVVAFEGDAIVKNTNQHLRLCSLLACSDDSIISCGGKTEKIGTQFTKITVKGIMTHDDGIFYVPSTLDTYLLPIQDTTYCDTKNTTAFVKLTTTKAENVVVFGLLGVTSPSAAVSIKAFGYIIFAVLLNVLYLNPRTL